MWGVGVSRPLHPFLSKSPQVPSTFALLTATVPSAELPSATLGTGGASFAQDEASGASGRGQRLVTRVRRSGDGTQSEDGLES